jgi:hypothetical protein
MLHPYRWSPCAALFIAATCSFPLTPALRADGLEGGGPPPKEFPGGLEEEPEVPAFPTLPPAENPPERSGPLLIYFEGPQVLEGDLLWSLYNTRFQIRADTRQLSSSTNIHNITWAGNNFPGDFPLDGTIFRPYAGPSDFAQQVINRIHEAYKVTASVWPIDKPKEHGFQLIGPNADDSPWRDVDNPRDYITFGGSQFAITLASATAAATGDTITSTDLATFATNGPPDWAPDGTHAKGDVVVAGSAGLPFVALNAGTSVSPTDPIQPDFSLGGAVVDGSITWQEIDNIGRIMLQGFSNPANNGLFKVKRRPSHSQIKVYRLGAGGDPAHLANETSTNAKLHYQFAPSLWHANGRVGSDVIALANFQAMKAALDDPFVDLDADISRTFTHYVEDDESTPDVKPVSERWFLFDLVNWTTDGLWQRYAADPRMSNTTVDGLYTANQLLDRAGSVMFSGVLPAPDLSALPWSPRAQTLRAWQWVNTRASQNIISENRFQPFKAIFGEIPCGNWNMGATSGDPAARLIIEPHGGESSTGIAIDNYAGSAQWNMSIPGMYGGVLGDYRGYDLVNIAYFEGDSIHWSCEKYWTEEAQLQGVNTSTTALHSVARHFQIGETALREYAASIKRNYGYAHQVMPSLEMAPEIIGVSNLTDRQWILVHLSRELSKAYLDGLIDSVWAFDPDYAKDTAAAAAERAAWYTLSSQVFRLTTQPTDYDFDRVKTINDVYAFLDAWFASDPISDFNKDDVLNPQDLFDFLDAWMAP